MLPTAFLQKTGTAMSSSHPLELHAPGWHDEARTPVVDNKYYDRATGEIRTASEGDHQEYMGPPSVDILIRSQHVDTVQCATAPRERSHGDAPGPQHEGGRGEEVGAGFGHGHNVFDPYCFVSRIATGGIY
ncbi:hypothetical protein ISF_03098 [Cordyceps fumosorosea ARSEF 2679]|uniref:Uncharacterized protein n=1 Tax=Cordyceps fumosorosea (strain ARSEF 2679) TaxID=1081104 RepID=A0A168B9Z9_CORFA|nr:hypothetical protein ISF_03098 [Cordyceps fumosorosea ARSEF 2679]OAA69828.1 hypothetical protein ISF_03098 [Cordyceps fumosorosea ARSEF 2679]